MLQENDVVKLLANHPEDGVVAGELGAILCVFDTPNEAYEVEFVGENGIPKAQLTLLPSEVEPVTGSSD